ncbi:MAG: glycosyltransferase family 4 protein [Candidatus Uhrbacteria bacterium]|nr:glycosyltransferase family 4 protein [Candidatus Uhrbacteria bacterium]
MIRLGIDLRHVPTDGSPGAGIEHASNELAEALRRYAHEYEIETIEFRGKMRASILAKRARDKRIDALFCTTGAVPPLLPIVTFPWVHDVAIFTHPEWFPQSRFKRLLTTRLFLRGVRRAPHVFAVSEDTKRALVGITGIEPEKITVTYQGVRLSTSHTTTGNYALMIGTVEPRKNIPFIIELWEDVRQALGRDMRLVIVGKTGWGNVEIPSRDWIERVESATDEERDRFLAGARVLLLPSLHEGFGRPALEAMALGVPVVASNRGAIPEIMGEVGTLLDPHDRAAWVSAVCDAFSGRLDGRDGKMRAALFSWERTARTILAKVRESC